MNFTIIKTSLLVIKIVKINALNLIHQILLLENHHQCTTNVPITIGKETTAMEVPPVITENKIVSLKEKY